MRRVFECQSAPTAFYKSRLVFGVSNWEYTLKDGTMYVMGHQAPLQSIRDRYGNETRLTWSLTNVWGAGYGNLVRITSPNGRWIELTYDSASPVNHVTQAKDNIGRTVTYTYDTSGRLSTVTDPENNVTTYTWDTSNRLVSIKDGRNITWLRTSTIRRIASHSRRWRTPNATWQFAYERRQHHGRDRAQGTSSVSRSMPTTRLSSDAGGRDEPPANNHDHASDGQQSGHVVDPWIDGRNTLRRIRPR